MSENEALLAIEQTDGDLERWAFRGSKMPPEQPDRGSELAADDRIFPFYPVSEIARYSLLSAGEHLRLARLGIDARQLYPSAHSTVLRGALVGAAQGVWILGSEDGSHRQQRGLTVLTEIYKQNATYDRELLNAALGPTERAEVEGHLKHLALRATEVEVARTDRNTLNLTDVIAAALDDTFARPPQRKAGRELWRQISGDAHVLAWPAFRRGPVTAVDRSTGLGVIRSTGQLTNIAEPYICAYRMLKHGWRLFDRRCEAP